MSFKAHTNQKNLRFSFCHSPKLTVEKSTAGKRETPSHIQERGNDIKGKWDVADQWFLRIGSTDVDDFFDRVFGHG